MLLEVSLDEREMLMEAEPDTFFFTPHYKDYPCVLARIASLHPGSLRNFLERRFKKIAPKKTLKAWEAEQGWESNRARHRFPSPSCGRRCPRRGG